jgi:hypothetical protein
MHRPTVETIRWPLQGRRASQRSSPTIWGGQVAFSGFALHKPTWTVLQRTFLHLVPRSRKREGREASSLVRRRRVRLVRGEGRGAST